MDSAQGNLFRVTPMLWLVLTLPLMLNMLQGLMLTLDEHDPGPHADFGCDPISISAHFDPTPTLSCRTDS